MRVKISRSTIRFENLGDIEMQRKSSVVRRMEIADAGIHMSFINFRWRIQDVMSIMNHVAKKQNSRDSLALAVMTLTNPTSAWTFQWVVIYTSSINRLKYPATQVQKEMWWSVLSKSPNNNAWTMVFHSAFNLRNYLPNWSTGSIHGFCRRSLMQNLWGSTTIPKSRKQYAVAFSEFYPQQSSKFPKCSW